MVWGPPGRWDLYSHTTRIYYSHTKSLFHMGRWMKVLSARGGLFSFQGLFEWGSWPKKTLLGVGGFTCGVRIKHQPTDCWSILKHVLLCWCVHTISWAILNGICFMHMDIYNYVYAYIHTHTYTYIIYYINKYNNMCVWYIPLFIYPPFVSLSWDAWFYLNTAPHQLAFGPAPDWKASPGPGTTPSWPGGAVRPHGFVWKCWVYSQWNSHLIGIMISKTRLGLGVHYFQTHPHVFELGQIWVMWCLKDLSKDAVLSMTFTGVVMIF